MVNKIQNFIEDHMSINVTRNQVFFGLILVISIIVLIVIILFQLNSPQIDAKTVQPKLFDNVQPYAL